MKRKLCKKEARKVARELALLRGDTRRVVEFDRYGWFMVDERSDIYNTPPKSIAALVYKDGFWFEYSLYQKLQDLKRKERSAGVCHPYTDYDYYPTYHHGRLPEGVTRL